MAGGSGVVCGRFLGHKNLVTDYMREEGGVKNDSQVFGSNHCVDTDAI